MGEDLSSFVPQTKMSIMREALMISTGRGSVMASADADGEGLAADTLDEELAAGGVAGIPDTKRPGTPGGPAPDDRLRGDAMTEDQRRKRWRRDAGRGGGGPGGAGGGGPE